MSELLYKELTFSVIGAAMEVHRILGSGFLEAVYQVALEHEMALRKIPFERQVRLPVSYKDVLVGEYVADFIVDGKLVVELKLSQTLTRNIRLRQCTILLRQDCAWHFCSTLVPAPSNTVESLSKAKQHL